MENSVIVLSVVASVVSVVAGLVIVRRRGLLWRLTSLQAFGGAVLMALAVAMQLIPSNPILLTTIVFVIAFIAFSLYIQAVRSRLTRLD